MAMHKATDYTCFEMQPLVARVKNGRLVLDEPTDLPEGEEVRLMPMESDEDEEELELDEAEREALDAELRASIAEAKAGQLIDAEEVLAEIRARRT